jgi:hypothetical protein
VRITSIEVGVVPGVLSVRLGQERLDAPRGAVEGAEEHDPAGRHVAREHHVLEMAGEERAGGDARELRRDLLLTPEDRAGA